MLKKTDSKLDRQKHLLKLGSGIYRNKTLSEEEMLIQRIDSFNLNNEPFPDIIRDQQMNGEVHSYNPHVPDHLRQAYDRVGMPKSNWPRIDSKDDFILRASERFDRVRNRCESFQKPPVQRFDENGLNLEAHYDRALEWIEMNKLSEHKASTLFHITQLLPALIDPEEMKTISKLRVERLKKILVSIETLNNLGVLVEDSLIANRSLWGEARVHIVQQISIAKTIGKYQGFQPQLIRFSKFLKDINSWGNKNKVFNLFHNYGIINTLYEEHNLNYHLQRTREKRIKNRISSDLSEMRKVKALPTLLQYR